VYGTASATMVSSGGLLVVYSGGIARDALILSSGYMFVGSNGDATGATLQSGFAYVAAGGVLRNTIDSGGVDDVVGSASGTVVSSGGTELVTGLAVGATVSNGGLQQVTGVASGTLVAGGYELVLSGGSAVSPTIADNGTVYVAASGGITGATVSAGSLDLASGASDGAAPLTFAGGTGLLILNDAQHFGGLVAGFTGAAEIDLVDIPFVGAGAGATTYQWSQTTPGSNGSGTLTVSEGASVANIMLLGQYAQGNFMLSAGPVGGTLVVDPPLTSPINPAQLASPLQA
jgi:autotransporter passenger strand-loop-strand repeat protein